MFLNRVSDEDYERLIKSAVDANMNMLRIWGGGIYEKEIFYDLCDEHGILVWQDFMFACAMYPGNQEFIDNVRKEAVQNVKRLRNHPSIALWCGDNENLSAWNRWGWKENVLENQGQNIVDTVWKAYDDIIHNLLPDVVNEFDPQRYYWPSSPSSGFGELENGKSGDMHYWGVWWAKEPFEKYEEVIPRFMSEYGFQSFPDINTVRKYTVEADHDIYSEVMKSHQRSSIGNVTIEEYLKRDYKDPKNFEMFLYVGQVLQSKGIIMGVEAHRRNMPFCMGTLYWQLNDVWPVASWSGIDYYGRWKALHYDVRDAMKPVIISVEKNDDKLNIYSISDKLEDVEVELTTTLMSFTGGILHEIVTDEIIKANSSNIIETIERFDLLDELLEKEVFLYAKIKDTDGNLIDDLFYYYVSPKDLDLTVPKLGADVEFVSTGKFNIHLRTDRLAKDVYINIPFDGHLGDNYFDMLPRSNRIITYETDIDVTAEIILEQLKVYSLVDSYK